jgi:hypothetical protein
MLHIGTRIASAQSRAPSPTPWTGCDISCTLSSMLLGTVDGAESGQGGLRYVSRTIYVTFRQKIRCACEIEVKPDSTAMLGISNCVQKKGSSHDMTRLNPMCGMAHSPEAEQADGGLLLQSPSLLVLSDACVASQNHLLLSPQHSRTQIKQWCQHGQDTLQPQWAAR